MDQFTNRKSGFKWSHKAVTLALLFGAIVSIVAQGKSPSLAGAVEARNPARTSKLLSNQIDVNVPQVDGMTALHWAAYHDNWELGQRLLDLGANASAQNRYGITPLYLACVNGNAKLVRMLIESGADPDTTTSGDETVLMTAARTGDIGAVTSLINAGAEIDAKERNGQTAAMWAAAEGHSDVIQALLSAGAIFNRPWRDLDTRPSFLLLEKEEQRW